MIDRLNKRIFSASYYGLLSYYIWRQTDKDQRTVCSLYVFSNGNDVNWFLKNFPKAIEKKRVSADQIKNHIFDFLGTGYKHWGNKINWHKDIKSGHKWPMRFYTDYAISDLTPGNGIDVKIPWELSRCHQMVVLAQLWYLTNDKKYAEECFSQWESWLSSNPWCYGINWTCTMEVAIRAVNWLWAFMLLSTASAWTSKRKRKLSLSLWQHATYIEHNLEVGVQRGQIIKANHYLSNVCALACLGLICHELPGVERWRKVGLKSLENEIRRQVLSDGFFFESSTSYHRLAVELFLIPAILAKRVGYKMTGEYWARLEKMLEVILYMKRPDGCVPQIGDNDDGRLLILNGYPDWPRHDHRYLLALGAVLFNRSDFKVAAGEECPEDVFWLLGQDGVEKFKSLISNTKTLSCKKFPEGGLYTINNRDRGDYAIVRTGLAPVNAPTAHAHNDTLSLELWLSGQPVFIDPGTFCYTSDLAQRNHFRSTVMHNTVMVGGYEINRIPTDEPFRLERDAVVQVLEWHSGQEDVWLVAERATVVHENLHVRHKRKFIYKTENRGSFVIEDEIEPADNSFIYWHLPYECTMQTSGNGKEVFCEVGLVCIKIISDTLLSTSMYPVEFAISYGLKTKGFTLRVSLDHTMCTHIKTHVSRK
ncbi:MAG: alginate lyase family protein [Candidatus Scalindua sp.]